MNKAKRLSRLMSCVKVDTKSKCWLWQGYLEKNGYGRLSVGHKRQWAHIHFYNLIVGPVPDGLELDHLCRNHACVNPAHLEPVTHKENMRRSPFTACHIHRAKTHCPQGHPYSGSNLVEWGGFRYCRTCQNEYKKQYKLRKRNENRS